MLLMILALMMWIELFKRRSIVGRAGVLENKKSPRKKSREEETRVSALRNPGRALAPKDIRVLTVVRSASEAHMTREPPFSITNHTNRPKSSRLMLSRNKSRGMATRQ